ncbi:FAD-dependent monooxygenase [Saprospiraceae bacterium]|nr:FAD-dependent monooxygenase [Saprospiraceae bacterium]
MSKVGTCWRICEECRGRGKGIQKIGKQARIRYQAALDHFEKMKREGKEALRPKRNLFTCPNCHGSGLLPAISHPIPDREHYPHVAIVGGGIGGVAMAVACLHRGIPFSLYERDKSFDARSQGYGLTLQQASKAIEGLGIFSLKEGVVSTRHLAHNPDGKVIGEWGMRKWLRSPEKKPAKRTNVHIPRQALRLALLEQLGGSEVVNWGHRLIKYAECEGQAVELSFEVDGEIESAKADLVVGADGIRSTVRELLIGDDVSPLRYLGCMVILGICSFADLEGLDSSLLDSATVFQTANGHERIYMMPFSTESVMWQLSFPIDEEKAKLLSSQGPKALKEEACRRTPWHDPIPQIMNGTKEALISGYPVYDRDLLTAELVGKSSKVTLIGDAAHPMSPFKGQGANQALLDAIALARGITQGCRPLSQWKDGGIRASVLTEFEAEMLERTAPKVRDSAEASRILHSEIALLEGDRPRSRHLKNDYKS